MSEGGGRRRGRVERKYEKGRRNECSRLIDSCTYRVSPLYTQVLWEMAKEKEAEK